MCAIVYLQTASYKFTYSILLFHYQVVHLFMKVTSKCEKLIDNGEIDSYQQLVSATVVPVVASLCSHIKDSWFQQIGEGWVVVMTLWQFDLQLPVQSAPITTNVDISNPAHGKVYSIQHYVRKFVSDLRQVGGFL